MPALRNLNISGCKVRGDEAHQLGKGLARNGTLERLLIDKIALNVQQLIAGERLNMSGIDFSEVDAALMAQLLVHNTQLRCADMSGSKPLQREMKLLSDALVRCSLPLQAR